MIAVRSASWTKFHLASDGRARALCGAEAPTVAGWLHVSSEEHIPAWVDLGKVCKRCEGQKP